MSSWIESLHAFNTSLCSIGIFSKRIQDATNCLAVLKSHNRWVEAVGILTALMHKAPTPSHVPRSVVEVVARTAIPRWGVCLAVLKEFQFQDNEWKKETIEYCSIHSVSSAGQPSNWQSVLHTFAQQLSASDSDDGTTAAGLKYNDMLLQLSCMHTQHIDSGLVLQHCSTKSFDTTPRGAMWMATLAVLHSHRKPEGWVHALRCFGRSPQFDVFVGRVTSSASTSLPHRIFCELLKVACSSSDETHVYDNLLRAYLTRNADGVSETMIAPLKLMAQGGEAHYRYRCKSFGIHAKVSSKGVIAPNPVDQKNLVVTNDLTEDDDKDTSIINFCTPREEWENKIIEFCHRREYIPAEQALIQMRVMANETPSPRVLLSALDLFGNSKLTGSWKWVTSVFTTLIEHHPAQVSHPIAVLALSCLAKKGKWELVLQSLPHVHRNHPDIREITLQSLIEGGLWQRALQRYSCGLDYVDKAPARRILHANSMCSWVHGMTAYVRAVSGGDRSWSPQDLLPNVNRTITTGNWQVACRVFNSIPVPEERDFVHLLWCERWHVALRIVSATQPSLHGQAFAHWFTKCIVGNPHAVATYVKNTPLPTAPIWNALGSRLCHTNTSYYKDILTFMVNKMNQHNVGMDARFKIRWALYQKRWSVVKGGSRHVQGVSKPVVLFKDLNQGVACIVRPSGSTAMSIYDASVSLFGKTQTQFWSHNETVSDTDAQTHYGVLFFHRIGMGGDSEGFQVVKVRYVVVCSIPEGFKLKHEKLGTHVTVLLVKRHGRYEQTKVDSGCAIVEVSMPSLVTEYKLKELLLEYGLQLHPRRDVTTVSVVEVRSNMGHLIELTLGHDVQEFIQGLMTSLQ
eukprot:PhF_6_TR40790/c0_g1_i1/m.61603